MRLYLVQHAKAKSKDEDPDRPLTDQGWNDIKKVAAFIAGNKQILVNNIIHSGKTRARQTAEVLAEELEPTGGIFQGDGLGPMDEASLWITRLVEEKEEIMLVGHLPHLNKLISRLLGYDENKQIVAFKNAGVVCIERDETGNWSVTWMVTPEILN